MKWLGRLLAFLLLASTAQAQTDSFLAANGTFKSPFALANTWTAAQTFNAPVSFNAGITQALAQFHFFIGNGAGVSADTALSGDCVYGAGGIVCTKTNGVVFGTLATAANVCASLSNAAASCSTDTTNAANITSGTLASARGGAGAVTGALKANGAGVVSQAACADLSNGAASCSTDTTSATNITSGTLPSGRLAGSYTGITGVGTLTAGTWTATTIAVANGGTGDTGTAWSAFTPTPTCGTATITTGSARSKTLGKTTWFQVDFTITAIGTCTTTLTWTAPNTPQSTAGYAGIEVAVSGFSFGCSIRTAGSATVTCSPTGGVANFGVNDRLLLAGVYENQ